MLLRAWQVLPFDAVHHESIDFTPELLIDSVPLARVPGTVAPDRRGRFRLVPSTHP